MSETENVSRDIEKRVQRVLYDRINFVVNFNCWIMINAGIDKAADLCQFMKDIENDMFWELVEIQNDVRKIVIEECSEHMRTLPNESK